MVLVAEEHVAVVGVQGAGEVFLVHLRPRKAVLGVVECGGSSHERKATTVVTRENGSDYCMR